MLSIKFAVIIAIIGIFTIPALAPNAFGHGLGGGPSSSTNLW